ncbi:MAG: Zn-dependent hydrolase [Sphingomonas bacterium]|uniref:allantoate amidohydrolase n=1 Tax=Sphingomonas bacterium TaxID=1895847 RepID=UPI00261219F2|nr:allantoate amidohydrolase [Sphingomonas bacterium]MDB5703034.1 Zn-dependent hydrolase [Sphingomonas bacterium]
MVSGGARAVERCDALGVAPYSDAPDGLYRGWLTPAFAAAQQAIAGWMAEAGMTARIDGATNLIGRYEGATPDAPALLIGSHIDSVRDAGRYDGPLGVMLGVECVAALSAAGKCLPFAIEVIAFGDEEGSRFPSPMLTSRAVAGGFDPASLSVVGLDGATIEQALVANDYAPGRFAEAARAPGSVIAYLEAHIEQGPALEADGLAVGVVTGIAAQLRYRVVVEGMAGHAGTTSMALRRDALAAAAEMVLAVERIGGQGPSDLVATVGRLQVSPGAVNVIPGHADFSIDIRALDPRARDTAAEAILTEIKAIGTRREVVVSAERVHDLAASPCDPKLMDLLSAALAAEGQAERRLASGAGHDAMVMASLCPTAMLFLRCAGGVSHNPAEAVDPADVEIARRVMLGFIERLGAAFLGETL